MSAPASPESAATASVSAAVSEPSATTGKKRAASPEQSLAAKHNRKAGRQAAAVAAKKRRVLEAANETEYYFENGLRKVRPYKFIYHAHAKGRWLGRPLLDVFMGEFRDLTPAYYKDAIETGRITVNGAKSSVDYIVRNGDLIGHALHRVEPPVTGDPIGIVSQTDDLLVVSKPASIPVHPSGRYRHNSLLFILRREHEEFAELYPIHRLDRLTSGVLLLPRTKAKSLELQRQLLGQELQKEYLCRVQGVFPEGEVECAEPIAVFHHKLGLNVVAKDGKPCRTVFRRVATTGRTSLVHCRPYTGRTHQIRVHLQFLGFPIANDPLYAHPAWGPARGRGGVDEEERQRVLERFYGMQQRGTYDEEARGVIEKKKEAEEPKEKTAAEAAESFWSSPSAAVSQRPDPPPHKMCLWLHAHKYSGPAWEHVAPPPAWASEDFEDDKDIELSTIWSELAVDLGDEGDN